MKKILNICDKCFAEFEVPLFVISVYKPKPDSDFLFSIDLCAKCVDKFKEYKNVK